MLDLDRGVTKRRHPNGFVVAMYKDEPGVFVDIKGGQVTEAIAEQAGFDIETLSVQRRKNEKMAEAREKIESEFASQTEEMERILDARTDSYAVRHVGGGKYGIFDDAGNRLTEKPLTKAEAEGFVDKLELPTEDETAKTDGQPVAGHGSEAQQPEA